jgi:hypothetical protein
MDAEEAENLARNCVVEGGDSTLVYGTLNILPGLLASAEFKVLGILDLEHKFNAHWKRDMQLFEEFVEKYEAKSTHVPATFISESPLFTEDE